MRAVRRSNMTVIGLVLVGMVALASVASPYFLDIFNIQSVIRDLAFIGMVAMAQAMLLIIGELDLSVGAVASLCGIFSGIMMVWWGWNPFLSLAVALLLGAALGSFNGLIVTKLRLNSLVVTIGMMGVYGGINLVLTKGKAITGIPEQIYFLGKGNIGPIPVPFFFTLAILALMLFVARKTRTGRYMYAIGNSREAARILGIRVDRIRVFVFALAGFTSALAGILYVARLGSSQSVIGDAWPMNSIASSVIGGVSLAGGIGNPAGALIGAAIIGVIQNAIVLFKVNVYWQSAVSGIVVVVAISLSSVSVMLSERKLRRSKLAAIGAGAAEPVPPVDGPDPTPPPAEPGPAAAADEEERP